MATLPGDALLSSLEADLVHVHRMRMAERQGELMAQLRVERAKAEPDATVIASIKASMLQAERDKQDLSITERELLAPLREQRQSATASGDANGDATALPNE